MASGFDGVFTVDARPLGGGAMAQLSATAADGTLLRSEPVWIASGWILRATVSGSGVAAEALSDEAACGERPGACGR